jgi:DnaK suppressor protein
MDQREARARLTAERGEVEALIKDAESAARQGQEAEQETGDVSDPAQPLTAEGEANAIAASLRERLTAIDRALRRLDDGTYGQSVRSGRPIPDERLDADPAAELTIEEARAQS